MTTLGFKLVLMQRRSMDPMRDEVVQTCWGSGTACGAWGDHCVASKHCTAADTTPDAWVYARAKGTWLWRRGSSMRDAGKVGPLPQWVATSS